jgi:hypothetical protein
MRATTMAALPKITAATGMSNKSPRAARSTSRPTAITGSRSGCVRLAGLGSLNWRTHGCPRARAGPPDPSAADDHGHSTSAWVLLTGLGDGLALPTDEPMAAYGGPACRGGGSVAVAGAALAQRVVLRSGQ